MSDNQRRILLVDDEELVRNALRRALRREPYVIEEAADPEQALELLEIAQFDLLLADQMMPGMTGLELLAIARQRWPDMMRVILTGHADASTAIAAINEGEIYRFLTKPWDDLELKVTLFNAFERLDLERENRRLLGAVRRQRSVLDQLERQYPGIGTGQPAEAADGSVTEERIRAVLGGNR